MSFYSVIVTHFFVLSFLSKLTVVDCPSEDYLDSLLSNQQLSTHQDCGDDDARKPALVIHLTPVQVFETQMYQQWMDR